MPKIFNEVTNANSDECLNITCDLYATYSHTS